MTTDELANAAEGLLDPERAAFAESHIADCPDCHAQSDAGAVSATLQAEPARTMPEAVAHRLNGVTAAEHVRRAETSVKGGAESVAGQQPRQRRHVGEEPENPAALRWQRSLPLRLRRVGFGLHDQRQRRTQ